MIMEQTALKEMLFARGAKMGLTDMEVYYQSSRHFEVNIFKGEVDRYTLAEDGGLSFRGLFGGKMGYAYAEKIDETSIDHLLEGARASAEINDGEDAQVIFSGSETYADANFYAEALEQAEPADRIELLKQIEAECHRLDPRVKNVQYCAFGSFATERMIANTRGLARSERMNRAGLYLWVVVQDGSDVKSAGDFQLTQDLRSLDGFATARKVTDEALSYLGAEPVESGRYPVLLRNRAAASLLKTFIDGFYGLNVQKGKSLLKGKIGERIASENITIVDDPFLQGGAANQSFDSEGVAARRLTLVQSGELKSFLHNLKSAAADGVAPTGHGHKPSYKGAIGTAPSNLYIEPGSREYGELIESCDEAVVITSLSGLHSGANPISGAFSLQAHGYYVKGGKIRRPVNQITIGGNFFEVLNQIEEVGSDLAFGFPGGGYVGSPTLKIQLLTVAGK